MGTGEEGGVVTKELPQRPADEGIIPRARRRMEEIVAVRRYSGQDVASELRKTGSEIEGRIGSDRFEAVCTVLAQMTDMHAGVTPKFFADSIMKNKNAIDKFYDAQIKKRQRANIYDVYSLAVSAVAVGNVFGINPAKLLAIADTESGFDTIAISKNADGTSDYGACQINDRSNTLKTYRPSRDYWMKRLNSSIKKLGGQRLLTFPENIWPPNAASLNPAANTWAAALTLTEKRAFNGVNTWTETFTAYNGSLGNPSSIKYGSDVATKSDEIEKKYGFRLIEMATAVVKK